MSLTSQKARPVNATILVAGVAVPCVDWATTLASNGSLGTFNAKSSIAMIGVTGIDVNALAETPEGAQLDLYVGYNDGSQKHLFGGVLDAIELELESDSLIIEGRDWGALLVDSKETIADLNYKNQTCDQIAQQIAKKMGLKAKVTGTDVKAGAEFDGEHVLMTHPQPLWSVLQSLAEQCGFELRVTPDRELYFGPPEEGASMTGTWGAKPGQVAENKLLKCKIRHSPRRNKFFEVHVVSYHPHTTQRTSGKATNNSGKTSGKASKQHAVVGSSSGRSGMGVFKGRNGLGGNGTQATITVFRDGLTQEQCVALAEAIAKDIAKREVLVTGTFEGLPELAIHQPLKLAAPNGSLAGYENKQYFITAATHKFTMQSGYTTEFKALTDPVGVTSGSGQ